MADNVEQIKEKLSIEEVVSWYVTLKPAGGNLKARCPFHTEKSPSFMVSPARGTYHCFGCGVGGDMFSFIQAIEGTDFMGALTMLAERTGVTLTFEKNAPKSDKDTLYALVADAVLFYQSVLAEQKDALQYLYARGLTDETVKNFRLGFAPDSWDSVRNHLSEKKYTDVQMERAGLIKRSEKGSGYYDRFRSRIMFPINDSVGRPVGFSGRTFGTDDKDVAKYINSPETELYDKSSVLFGFDRAKQVMRRNNFAVLVEGQMDLILSHQIKYTNTVALSGTALSPGQVRAIARLTKNLVIALDGDKAGIEATMKSARSALKEGFDVKVAQLPEGKDPADVIHAGGLEVWKECIKHAQHIVPFLFGHVRAHTRDERSFQLRATKEVLPFIREIESPVDRAHFIRVASRELAVSEQVVEQELLRMKEERPESVAVSPPTPPGPLYGSATEEAIKFLVWRESVQQGDSLREVLKGLLGETYVSQMVSQFSNAPEVLFRMEEMYGDDAKLKEQEILTRVERIVLEERIRSTGVALKKAEATGDAVLIHEAVIACEEARKAMSTFQERM